ncbi:peptidase inhibitor family I36 protein [Kitasatospora sp. NPDC002040]|uniref:peptidase inhibitor family I36 protein n=1 Tax=Kitasatospora sp. NPDC002040 TaxID=3154661 RepID=UPI00332E525F
MPAKRPRLLHRLTTLLIGLTTLTGLALVGASASTAADRDGVSEPGEFAIYGGPNTTYEVLDLYLSQSDFNQISWPRYGGAVNDQDESYWNRDDFTWHVYTDAWRGGRHGWISPGVSGNASSSFWHQISSAYYTAS